MPVGEPVAQEAPLSEALAETVAPVMEAAPSPVAEVVDVAEAAEGIVEPAALDEGAGAEPEA